MDTTYNTVLSILRAQPVTRNSDKVLIWEVYKKQGVLKQQFHRTLLVENDFITKCVSPESITRARRKAQELHKDLRSSSYIQKQKDLKESTGGNFIFKEIIK